MNEEKIKEILIKENTDFKKTYKKHQDCEKKLKKYQSRHYLNDKEQIKMKEIKKKKLLLKDKMQKMISNYEKGK